jgi:hypothetical protein
MQGRAVPAVLYGREVLALKGYKYNKHIKTLEM